ncbi:MAG: TatD family hydrolase [Dehalococcoidia bacterium]
MEPWFDTHVHWDRYSEPERKAMLSRAADAEVRFISVAVDLASSSRLLACEGAIGVCVGVHPRHAGQPLTHELRDLTVDPAVLAIGECGFDVEGSSAEEQSGAFAFQATLARERGLPIVLHIDGPGCFERLVQHGYAVEGVRVIRHYFTGDQAQADWHRDRAHYLSFGNPLRRDPGLREIARHYPEHLLLIETDSYPLPNRNTEPAHVARVGETLALLRDWRFAEAREILAENTRAAFPALSR